MIYYFLCDKCNSELEFSSPISIGPPKNVQCNKCNIDMIHQLGGHFLLYGHGWPGKDLKQNDYISGKQKEKTQEKLKQDKDDQKNSNEVIAERRKGRKSYNDFKKRNTSKVDRYKKAMKRGIKGK